MVRQSDKVKKLRDWNVDFVCLPVKECNFSDEDRSSLALYIEPDQAML